MLLPFGVSKPQLATVVGPRPLFVAVTHVQGPPGPWSNTGIDRRAVTCTIAPEWRQVHACHASEMTLRSTAPIAIQNVAISGPSQPSNMTRERTDHRQQAGLSVPGGSRPDPREGAARVCPAALATHARPDLIIRRGHIDGPDIGGWAVRVRVRPGQGHVVDPTGRRPAGRSSASPRHCNQCWRVTRSR